MCRWFALSVSVEWEKLFRAAHENLTNDRSLRLPEKYREHKHSRLAPVSRLHSYAILRALSRAVADSPFCEFHPGAQAHERKSSCGRILSSAGTLSALRFRSRQN